MKNCFKQIEFYRENIEVAMDVDSLIFTFEQPEDAIKFDELKEFQKLSTAFQIECECIQCGSHTCAKKGCRDYDKCARKKKNEGLKGVDILFKTSECLYLIEAKDYRKCVNPPTDHIILEVAKKFRDTLFGVWCVGFISADESCKNFLKKIRMEDIGIEFIFHFESPTTPYRSGLHGPKNKIVPLLDIQEKLAQKLVPMKDCLRVVDMDAMAVSTKYSWTVGEKYETEEIDC